MEETEITIFKELEVRMFVNISACHSQASFRFENRNPDSITSCLSTEAPDFQSGITLTS